LVPVALRKEDQRFLTGNGQYTDDITCPPDARGLCALAPRPRDASSRSTPPLRLAMPGVVAIFTGADVAADKIGGLPCGWLITDVNGQPMKEPPHPVLAQGKVRYVGDHVAMVIAETLDQAKDAAELVEVDYECCRRGGRARRGQRPAPRHSRRSRPTTSATLGIGRQGGGGRGLCQGRAHHQAGPCQQPARAQRDGAARSQRAVQPQQRRATRCMWPTRTRTSSAC
jgi:CO/xanthine dehydrogenase Mo-binding subunit